MSWFRRRPIDHRELLGFPGSSDTIEHASNIVSLALANANIEGTLAKMNAPAPVAEVNAGSSSDEHRHLAENMIAVLDTRASELQSEIDRLNADLADTLLSREMYAAMIERFDKQEATRIVPQATIAPPTGNAGGGGVATGEAGNGGNAGGGGAQGEPVTPPPEA